MTRSGLLLGLGLALGGIGIGAFSSGLAPAQTAPRTPVVVVAGWPPAAKDLVNVEVHVGIAPADQDVVLYTVPSDRWLVVTKATKDTQYYQQTTNTNGYLPADLVEDLGGVQTTKIGESYWTIMTAMNSIDYNAGSG